MSSLQDTYEEQFFDLSRLPLRRECRIDRSDRIYVNRNLHMQGVRWIGFDMDYTLAIYRKEAIEKLAFDLTRENLIQARGYPEEIRDVEYRPGAVIRGVVLDRKLGNLLKMDRYHYVHLGYHGTRRLTWKERRDTYANRKIRLGLERYYSMDTLFHLPEAYLFQQLVAFSDDHPRLLRRSYEQIFGDVRECLDLIHKDGSLKEVILANLDQYFEKDARIALTLDRFLKEGKKLFLLTNSEWFYTDAVMSYLFNGVLDYFPHWTDYFEVSVVQARKPAFFLEAIPLKKLGKRSVPRKAKVFKGGNFTVLEREISAYGDSILFVGDHIYGDILRSKQNCGWRTAMIVEELEEEIAASQACGDLAREEARLRDDVDREDFRKHLLSMKISMLERMEKDGTLSRRLRKELASRKREHKELDSKLRRLQRKIHHLQSRFDAAHNPSWGPVFKVGNEVSRLGAQIGDYACLYTSRVTNFLAYPANKYFRAPRDLLPHEL